MSRKVLIKTLKPFWKRMRSDEGVYYSLLKATETQMSKKAGIELEFFWCDNEIVGIGSADRTLKLIHDEELNDNRK